MGSRRGRRWPLLFISVIVGSFSANSASGQEEPSPESRYFDFWPGTWVEVVDGCPDASATTFTVRRSVGESVFEERWTLV